MSRRILEHPILPVPERRAVSFSFNGRAISGLEGDVISSALVAAGIDTFGHHVKDGSAQGLFCANGQCSQCLVMVDGLPVKACMTALAEGMVIESVEGLPSMPADDRMPPLSRPETREVEVLILGGGPAGLAAALELGAAGVQTLLVDDKHELGGKLVLQTHKFFGSEADSQAGTRGFLIGRRLAAQIAHLPSVEVWPDTTAVGVFSDGIVGVVRDGRLPSHPAPGPAGGHRRPRADDLLPRQHPSRRVRGGRLPDPGQPRPGGLRHADPHRGGWERGSHRRVPRAPGGHRGGRAGGGVAGGGRVQGARGQAQAAGRAHPHRSHHRLRRGRGARGAGDRGRARRDRLHARGIRADLRGGRRAHSRGPDQGGRVPPQGRGGRHPGLLRGGRGRDRGSLGGHDGREDRGREDRGPARPPGGTGARRLGGEPGDPALQTGSHPRRPRLRARGAGGTGLPLPAGDPLRSLRLGLSGGGHRHGGWAHHRRSPTWPRAASAGPACAACASVPVLPSCWWMPATIRSSPS